MESRTNTQLAQNLEFVLNCSPKLLYRFVSNETELATWFADEVNQKNNIITFVWDKEERKAEIVEKKIFEYIRFNWIEEDTYLSFTISQDPLTKTVSLQIIDFCEQSDFESNEQLWENAIQTLKERLGA